VLAPLKIIGGVGAYSALGFYIFHWLKSIARVICWVLHAFSLKMTCLTVTIRAGVFLHTEIIEDSPDFGDFLKPAKCHSESDALIFLEHFHDPIFLISSREPDLH
jgi:hypothetical protein